MPGSGKTYWGKKLASKLEFRFIDLDEHIERTQNKKISDLIKLEGEDHFRLIENQTLENILTNNKEELILCTGGGTPCFLNNLSLLKQGSFSLFINQDNQDLIKNLSSEIKKRPLFSESQDLELQLQSMYDLRKKYYNQADQMIDRPKDLSDFLNCLSVD